MKLLGTYKANGGFTVFELIIVIGLVILFGATLLPSFSSLQTGSQLESATYQLGEYLRLARSRSVARKGNKQYGVYLATTTVPQSFVLFRGSSYATRQSNFDQTIEVDTPISFSSTMNDEVVFDRASGATQATGTITIAHEVFGERTIVVNKLGVIDID